MDALAAMIFRATKWRSRSARRSPAGDGKIPRSWPLKTLMSFYRFMVSSYQLVRGQITPGTAKGDLAERLRVRKALRQPDRAALLPNPERQQTANTNNTK